LAQEAFVIAPPVTAWQGRSGRFRTVPRGTLTAQPRLDNVGSVSYRRPALGDDSQYGTQQVVAQFTDSANIALSGTYQKAFSWPAAARGTGYTATLRARSAAALTLAQEFLISPPGAARRGARQPEAGSRSRAAVVQIR